MITTKIIVDFPNGVSFGFEVPVVPRVGEHVVDPKTQQELLVTRVVHTLADQYSNSSVKVILSKE